MTGMNRTARAVALVGFVTATACGTALNYPGLAGPRYAGEAPGVQREATPRAPEHVRLVTWNTHFAQRIDRLIELLRTAEPAKHADVVMLQEVDAKGTGRIAEALGMSYVYYPAVVHPITGRDFGNAVLSRWPIVEDEKLILPHHGRFRDSQRAATAATILLGDDSLRLYSVHLSTMVEVGPGSRREQARTVLADAARFRRVIVGGDMNGVGVGDEFLACGFLWPTKDNAPTIHVFTWDHIFLKGLVLNDSAGTGVVDDDVGASDHRAVWAVARLGPSPDADAEPPTNAPGDSDRLQGCAALR